jgi:hypothetical protein
MMSTEHRKQIERILYQVVDHSMNRAKSRGHSRDHQMIYTIGYLVGMISQVAANDSQLEMQLYRLIRELDK